MIDVNQAQLGMAVDCLARANRSPSLGKISPSRFLRISAIEAGPFRLAGLEAMMSANECCYERDRAVASKIRREIMRETKNMI